MRLILILTRNKKSKLPISLKAMIPYLTSSHSGFLGWGVRMHSGSVNYRSGIGEWRSINDLHTVRLIMGHEGSRFRNMECFLLFREPSL